MPRTLLALSSFLLAACPADDEMPAGGSSSSGSATEETGTDDPGNGSAGTDETGAVVDERCVGWCAQRESCDDPLSDCPGTCGLWRRYRAEYFDANCQAATDARMQCVADAPCDVSSACDAASLEETEACTAGAMPPPGVTAYCTKGETCTDWVFEECIAAFLYDYFFYAYELGCAAEYDAWLACVVALDCATYMSWGGAACPTEVAAVEAACPDFG